MKKIPEYMKGIHSILTTSLNDDYSVNYQGIKETVEFGAKSNVDALIILGTQGEFYAFTHEETKEIIKSAVAAKGQKPLIAGTSAAGTYAAVDLTRYAKEIGADAVIVTPPFYCAVTMDGVYTHFQKLNEVGIPIVVYNAPARQGYNISPEFLSKIADLENVVAIKQATQNIVEHEKTIALVGKKAAVFGGSEAFMYPVIAIGCVGSSTTAATVFPQYFVDMYEAIINGDHEKARSMYDALEPFRRACEKFGHAAVVKYAGEKFFGLPGGPVRLPVPTPKKEDLVVVDQILKDLGVI